MYVCICNAITEKDIEKNPELNTLIGTVCGKCLNNGRRRDNKQTIKSRNKCFRTI